MKAYKLLRLRADGTLGPLFVGRGQVMRPRGTYAARADLPHPGLAHRPGFHCTAKPRAPHIKLRLKNGERRVWCEVRLSGWVTPHLRPECQGGLWYTAERMQIVRVLDPVAVDDVCAQCGGTGSYLSETAARYGDAAYVCPSCAGTGRRVATNGGKGNYGET